MSGILRLESLTKGNTLKQGDLTLLKYRLFDADGDKLDISGKPATVRLMKNDFTFIAYEREGLTVAPDDTISFNVNKILPGGLYHLEVIVDDKYIFPSRSDEGKFNVDKSSLGAELTIIENVGIDAVVRKAVDLINADPNLIIDEDKLVSDIISNTGIGSIEEYYQQFNDVITELSEDKDYHSLPEIAGARGGFDTLGERLNDVTAQLLQTIRLDDDNLSLNNFKESDRAIIQGLAEGEINAVLGVKNVKAKNIDNKSIGDLQSKYPLVRTKKATNLFEKSTVIPDYFVSWQNGNLVANSTFTASQKIDVIPGTIITLKYHNQLAFSDVEGNHVSGVSGEQNTNTLRTVTVPSGAYYMQVSTLKTNVEDQQINYGSKLLTYDNGSPKILNESFENGSISAEKIEQNSVGDDQLIYPLLRAEKSKNLYDTSKAVTGQYVSATSGQFFDSESYEVLRGVEVEPSTEYTIAHLNQSAFRDTDGKFISGLSATLNLNGKWTFTTPANAVTMDITTLRKFANTQQLNVGSELLPYENAYPKIDEKSLNFDIGRAESRLKGLTWNALGDSFTQEVPGGSPKYHYHIAKHTGVIVNDYGISGSTVSTVGGGGFEAMIERYEEMTDNADIITVLGGINDGARESFVLGDMNSTDISTFYGAYKSLIEGLIAKYPLKTILTITPTRQNDMDRHAEDIVKAIKEISDFHSIPCLDLYSNGGFNELNMGEITKDGLHPTDFGHKWLAGKILSFIESHIPLF